MNSALRIESTVLEIQELLPYYTKSYIRESIELLSESDEIISKKRTVFDIIKEKGKDLLKKAPGIISNLFRKLVKFNLMVIIAAQFYVASMSHFGIIYNEDLKKEITALKDLCKETPDSPEEIIELSEKLKNKVHSVNIKYKESSESGKDVILNIIKDLEFNRKLEETRLKTEKSINQMFQETIISLGEETLNIGVEAGKLSSEFKKVLEGKNTDTTYINRVRLKLINLTLLLKKIKVKKEEESQKKNNRSDEAVLRSYIKCVILESKA